MMNSSLLQLRVKTDKYLSIVHEMEKTNVHEDDYPEYIKIIPQYTIARCPFCNKEYNELIDTYTLRKWLRPGDGNFVFLLEIEKGRCEHFVVVQYFINFNGFTPEKSSTEIDIGTDFNPEVPHVLGVLLEDDFDCRAVMHSLPICRIENNKFIPKYTLYMITYYASEENIENLKHKLVKFDPGGERLELLIWPPKNEEGEIWWDLKYWVKKKKLLWIEPDNPEFPLRHGLKNFPYGNITGRKYPYFASVPPQEPRKRKGIIRTILENYFFYKNDK